MKKILLLSGIFFIQTTAFAHPDRVDELRKLTTIAPYTTNPEDVKLAFGEPTKIDRGKNTIMWTYTEKGRNMRFTWDLRVVKLQEYQYTTLPDRQKEFASGTCDLKTGVTKLADVFFAYGQPRDLHTDNTRQMLHYEFKEHNLRLFFRNGKLLNYEVNGLEKN